MSQSKNHLCARAWRSLQRPLAGLIAGLLVGLAAACGGSVEGPADPPDPGGPDARSPRVAPSAHLPPPNVQPAAPAPIPTAEQIAALEARVDEAPTDGAARKRLAIALFAARRRDAAVEQFEQIAEGRSDAAALIDLANAYGFVSRMDDAVATYRKALKAEPENATALFNLGDIAFLKGNADEAIELYRRSLASRPEFMRAHYQLARALEHQGSYREAYTTYAGALEFEPTTPEELLAYDDSLYRMASLDITMGAHERAESMLVALLEANPNHASAHYAYGQLLLQLGRLDEAQQQLEAHMTIRAATAPTTQVATGD